MIDHADAVCDPVRFLHHGHPYGREPWRQAQILVKELSRPGDLVLLAPQYLRLVWDYYDRGRLETLGLPGGKVLDVGPKATLVAVGDVVLFSAYCGVETPHGLLFPEGDIFAVVDP